MEKNEIVKQSQIRLNVGLDKENMPTAIHWSADDSDIDGQQEAKAMILSLWDGNDENAMRIDLWTKEMNVEEMNLFLFQTLVTLGDTYQRATNNSEIADDIREFAHHFGHQTKVFGEDGQEEKK